MARLAKSFTSILEGIIKTISYERHDYESVDEKSPSIAISRKTTKKDLGSKRLKFICIKEKMSQIYLAVK